MGRVTRGIKKTVKPFIDIPSWMGLDFIKSSTRNIKNMIVTSFVTQKPEVKEDFDETVVRQSLTDQDLERRKREFTILAIAMAVITSIAILYLIYLMINAYWKGSIVCFGVVVLAGSLAFRYHFWRFQLEKRKLGCSFREWWKEGLLGKK